MMLDDVVVCGVWVESKGREGKGTEREWTKRLSPFWWEQGWELPTEASFLIPCLPPPSCVFLILPSLSGYFLIKSVSRLPLIYFLLFLHEVWGICSETRGHWIPLGRDLMFLRKRLEFFLQSTFSSCAKSDLQWESTFFFLQFREL